MYLHFVQDRIIVTEVQYTCRYSTYRRRIRPIAQERKKKKRETPAIEAPMCLEEGIAGTEKEKKVNATCRRGMERGKLGV